MTGMANPNGTCEAAEKAARAILWPLILLDAFFVVWLIVKECEG